MLFCPKCQNLLIPKDGKMHCSCGYSQEDGKLTEKKKKNKTVAVVEKKNEVNVHPQVDADCKECGHTKAFFWTLQTRSADEPETRFFKCVKCGNTWREY